MRGTNWVFQKSNLCFVFKELSTAPRYPVQNIFPGGLEKYKHMYFYNKDKQE